jgi:hypothetical protein
MDRTEKFVSLGGSFDVGTFCTFVIYKDHRIRIPNHYFTSTEKEERDVLDYYLDTLPKIYGPKGMVSHEEVFGHIGTELNLKDAAEYLEISEDELYNTYDDKIINAELMFKVEDLRALKKGWSGGK